MTDGQIMTKQELCEFLGVSITTLWRYDKNGLLPYTTEKVNGRNGVYYKKQYYYCDEIVELRKMRNKIKGSN